MNNRINQTDPDKYGNPLATFTMLSACTPVGRTAPEAPVGFVSVGYTRPGGCLLGNPPGDGPADEWQMLGYQRVYKRKIPTSNDMGADCCSNLFGIAGSVECKARGYEPYGDTCNKIMSSRCNSNVGKSSLGNVWNGVPYGQNMTVFDGCSGKVKRATPNAKPGCLDEFCINYLKNAPPNSFFHDHDYSDYSHSFPRYSYTTPAFAGGFGYQPMRTPYYPVSSPQSKNTNNYCKQFSSECWNTRPSMAHY